MLYVTTKLLAPQSYANFISPRYIRAVADVDNIKQYNWSQFVADDDHYQKQQEVANHIVQLQL